MPDVKAQGKCGLNMGAINVCWLLGSQVLSYFQFLEQQVLGIIILQKRKLIHREVQKFTLCHTVYKQSSHDLKPDLSYIKSHHHGHRGGQPPQEKGKLSYSQQLGRLWSRAILPTLTNNNFLGSWILFQIHYYWSIFTFVKYYISPYSQAGSNWRLWMNYLWVYTLMAWGLSASSLCCAGTCMFRIWS